METNRINESKVQSTWNPSRNQALIALMLFGISTILCVGLALTKDPTPPFIPPPGATTDLDVFGRIINRVHGGEAFHSATHEELRVHDYPTRSVFNWRTPVYAWWLGSEFGWRFGRAILAFFVILTVVLFSRDLVDQNGLLPAMIGTVFYIGSTAWCFGGETYLFTEVWSGILIALSVCAYNRDERRIAVLTGLTALFYRELALPYCVVCLALALRSQRKAETAAWLAGIAAFILFMTWHSIQVQGRLTSADLAMKDGWIRFGGLRFVLSTAQTNIFLMPLPLWCTGVYLPLCLVGLIGSQGESASRIGWTISLYLLAFSVIGNPFNFYWGFLDAPLLATGIARAPTVLKTIATRAFASESRERARLLDA